MVAVYRLAGSMTMGGGASKRVVRGLEPSAAGIWDIPEPYRRPLAVAPVRVGAYGYARPPMDDSERGVVERLAADLATAQAVLDRLDTDPDAAEALLDALEAPASEA